MRLLSELLLENTIMLYDIYKDPSAMYIESEEGKLIRFYRRQETSYV